MSYGRIKIYSDAKEINASNVVKKASNAYPSPPLPKSGRHQLALGCYSLQYIIKYAKSVIPMDGALFVFVLWLGVSSKTLLFCF